MHQASPEEIVGWKEKTKPPFESREIKGNEETIVDSVIEHMTELPDKWNIEVGEAGWIWYKLKGSRKIGERNYDEQLRLSYSPFFFEAGISYYSSEDFDTVKLKLPLGLKIRLWRFLRQHKREKVLEARKKRTDRAQNRSIEMLVAN